MGELTVERGANQPRAEPVLLKVQLGAGEAVVTVTQRIWGATICPACFAVRGLLETEGDASGPYDQRCHCRRAGEPPEDWPGFDFNTYLELCRCCGIEALKSGSRWSAFFCSDCRTRVLSFDRCHRRWIIPIGRHSIMHGEFLSGDEASIDEHVEHFVLRARGLFAATDRLDTWASARVKQNLEALGWAAGQEADLSRYLRAAQERPLDKQAAFHGLREHFIHPIDPER
jgi:hypothetical protein